MSAPLIPYAGSEARPFVRKAPQPLDVLWYAIDSGQKRGLSLRQIADELGEPLERVHTAVLQWLERGR